LRRQRVEDVAEAERAVVVERLAPEHRPDRRGLAVRQRPRARREVIIEQRLAARRARRLGVRAPSLDLGLLARMSLRVLLEELPDEVVVPTALARVDVSAFFAIEFHGQRGGSRGQPRPDTNATRERVPDDTEMSEISLRGARTKSRRAPGGPQILVISRS